MAPRHAPPLQVEVSRQPLLQGLVALLLSASVAALIAAVAAHLPACWWLMLTLPFVAWFGWLSSAVSPRHLQWDGQTWRLAPLDFDEPGDAVQVRAVIDLGDWLLLRCHPVNGRWPPRHTYLPLSRAALGAPWGSLRATLYAARTRLPP